MPKQSETAELIVNGMIFRDWESISVRHAIRDQPPYQFRFTCSEAHPISSNFAKLQIKPGDACTVLMAGQLAITGFVVTRQVFVDAHRHHIELQGATYSHAVGSKAAVTKNFEFKDQKFEQIANHLLKPFGSALKVIGGKIPEIKFPRVSIQPGQTIYEVLDRISWGLGISFTSNPQGEFVASVNQGQRTGSDAVVEGQNMIEGRELIHQPLFNDSRYTAGQHPGSNDEWGAKAAHATSDKKKDQPLGPGQPAVIMTNTSAWSKEHATGRSNTERDWQNMDAITVLVTVLGWLRPSGGLWEREQQVVVRSPMLMMDGSVKLNAKSVTFVQDLQRGTRTILELCNPLALSQMAPQQ